MMYGGGKKGDPPPGRPAPRHKQVFASLGGKDQAIKRLAAWVARREGEHIRERVALTDGAEPLQKHVLAKLAGFTLVLDIIHVNEHLWQAGTAIYGETDAHRTAWVEAQMLDILSSRSHQVIQRLEDKAATLQRSSQAAKTLRGVANYLRRNQPHMDYAQYLRRGWPAVNENGDWDDFHNFRRIRRHQRLYGTPMNTDWLAHVERLEINQF
jgi:hypothetical protein